MTKPFRLAGLQMLTALGTVLLGIWLWPENETGWQARVAALLWLVAAIAVVGACFWVVVGLVDGQWRESGFRPSRWMAGNKKRR